MSLNQLARAFIRNETLGLLSRIGRMEPFAMHTPMTPAANLPLDAQVAIETHLAGVKRGLTKAGKGFLAWLAGPGRQALPRVAHRRFAHLRLQFVAALTQLDIFADVLNQRSEHDTGIWLAGMDAFAADALTLPGGYYKNPPVICYLERGPGAAIRRARTRLPGGDKNPVAVIQVPRERMLGSGIASSLVHEVGHQGSALLDLNNSMRPPLAALAATPGPDQLAWRCWERWVSEALADFWAVARLGVAGTVGLMNVVSLPKAFVFRIDMEDPHPSPYIRAKLSAAMGEALYPDPQWKRLGAIWDSFYPLAGLDAQRRMIFAGLERTMPRFVAMLVGHRPGSLKGTTLGRAVASPAIEPANLRRTMAAWNRDPGLMRQSKPTMAFAVLGQGKLDGVMDPARENLLVGDLLKIWALKEALGMAAKCATGAGDVKAAARRISTAPVAGGTQLTI